jgi:hypothetical protein
MWFDLLARELEGPEWRIALGVARIERRGLPRLPSPDPDTPWQPPDYLAELLLN